MRGMMKFIDSHVHFDSFAEKGEVQQILDRAREASVPKAVAIGGSDAANKLAQQVSAEYPGCVFPVIGYDRDEAGNEHDLTALEEAVGQASVVGVGETGLDYHYSADSAEAQKKLFGEMLDISARCSKPVVIHSREANADTLALLREHASAWSGEAAPGVLHCFTGNRAFAEPLLELGYMISFSGIVTFRSAEDIRKAAEVVPDDRFLIETDAPYLAPVPLRGKRNEPAYVVHVAELLAEVRGVPLDTLAEQSTANAERFFGI